GDVDGRPGRTQLYSDPSSRSSGRSGDQGNFAYQRCVHGLSAIVLSSCLGSGAAFDLSVTPRVTLNASKLSRFCPSTLSRVTENYPGQKSAAALWLGQKLAYDRLSSNRD